MEEEFWWKSYVMHGKQKAVAKVQEVGVQEASRLLKISGENLQRWNKQKDLLESAAITRGLNIGSKRRLKWNNQK